MTRKIPREFINELLNRVDLVEIIDSRLTLQKTGTNFSVCCPFHNEKTPSFTVSPQKQFYYCFGCGANGNAIGFLMAYENYSFIDAVDCLAKQAGLTLPTTDQCPGVNKEHERLFSLLREANKYYQQQLRQHADRKTIITYLKNRGVTGEVAHLFQLGFAPNGWENCKKFLLNKGYTVDEIFAAGLIVINAEGRSYDRFRNRLMFPIHNKKGQVIAFGGRVLDESKPKYLNSSESIVFHKNKELYGLFLAKSARNRDSTKHYCIVEGYMDVIALRQMGLINVVATLGTSITENHCLALFRETNKVIFCFDGDDAGKKAAWRALENCLPLMTEDRHVGFLFLSKNDDPDSFIRREGIGAFEKMSIEATPLGEYLLTSLQMQSDCTTMDGRSHFLALARPYLCKLPNNLFRQLLISKISKIVALEHAKIESFLQSGKLQEKRILANDKKVFNKNHNNTKQPLNLAQRIISLLLYEPKLYSKIKEELLNLKGIEIPQADLLFSLLPSLEGCLNTAGVLEEWRDKKEGTELAFLATKQWHLDQDGILQELKGAIKKILSFANEQKQNYLIEKVATLGLASLTDEEKELFENKFGKIKN